MGRRPTGYSDELAAEICDRIINGESLRSICNDGTAQRMPHANTVFKWLSQSNTDKKAAPFKDLYDRATKERTEAFAEDVLDIVDHCPESKEGVLKARLRAEVRMKHMAMRQPRKYGNTIDVTSGGEKLGAVAAVQFEVMGQQEVKEKTEKNKETEETNDETATSEGIETVSEATNE